MKIEFIINGKTDKKELEKLANEAGFESPVFIDEHLFSAECKNKKVFDGFMAQQTKLSELYKAKKKNVTIVRKAYNTSEIL